ncbi:MAG: c-type cytochrome, partial [Planctomycetota bacterium]
TTEVLARVEHAPDRMVNLLRRAVEGGRVHPTRAVAQIARHGGYGPETFTWLANLVEMVSDRALSDWDLRHLMAMAALRAMHDAPVAQWPEGYDRYHVPVDPAQLDAGRVVYEDEIVGCARCHGATGRGEEGFPPLDGAPWVLGDPERAASIVIHGLHGELEMPDGRTFTSVMDPLGDALTDQQIADVLTFVRRSWSNFAPPVAVADVTRARQRRVADDGAWTVEAVTRQYPLYADSILAAAPEPEAGRSRLYLLAVAIGVAILFVVAWRLRRGS